MLQTSVEGIWVLQCGDPTGTGSGGPGYGYGVENAPKDFKYPRGTLAMAHTQDPDSNGGQFFIVYDDTELPDPNGYSIFGKVTGGVDVLDKIAGVQVRPGPGGENSQPVDPPKIESIQITEG